MNHAKLVSNRAMTFRPSRRTNPTSPLLSSKKFRTSHHIAWYQTSNQTKQAKLRQSHLRHSTSSFSSSSKRTPPTENGSKRGDWKRNGTPEIVIGFTIFALVGIDQYLQAKHRKHRQEIVEELRLSVHLDTLEEKEKDEENEWIGSARSSSSSLLGKKVALFSCVVRRIPNLFDGNKSLRNVHVGDNVDILEENVGPDGMYHFCRVKRECGGGIGHEDEDESDNDNDEDDHYFNLGWFPIACLEKGS